MQTKNIKLFHSPGAFVFVSFCVFAQVFTGFFGRVSVCCQIYKVSAKSEKLKPASLVSLGNFHTLRRWFPTLEQALKFGELLKSRFAHGPTVAPRKIQPELF